MNKSDSKYFNTARLMNEAFIMLLDKKDFEYITVKELCDKAGVNRSTFYLHYETKTDLLEESLQYVLKLFYLKMEETDDFNINDGESAITEHIRNSSLDDLYLVTPKYLEPYLQFIQENKRLYRTVLQHDRLFELEKTYDYLYDKVFHPILDKFGQAENVKPYIVSFYINGLTAIIKQWLNSDCAESIREIIEIINICMNR